MAEPVQGLVVSTHARQLATSHYTRSRGSDTSRHLRSRADTRQTHAYRELKEKNKSASGREERVCFGSCFEDKVCHDGKSTVAGHGRATQSQSLSFLY